MSNTFNLCPEARRQYFDINGDPLSGGKLFYYQAGTTTKVSTYKDVAGTTLNTNPIILDASGRTPFAVFLSPEIQYKEVLAYSTDTDPPTSPVYTEDNISGRGVYGVVTIYSYGAVGDGVANDSPAFDAAIAALDVEGGKIIVPYGSYKLDTVIEVGERSIHWDIAPGTTWSGAGYQVFKFPAMWANGAQYAAGPYLFGQDNQVGPSGAATAGSAVLSVEYKQSTTVPQTTNACAMYVGARGDQPTGDVWCINPVIKAEGAADGVYQAIEIDVNNIATTGTPIMKGILITGSSTQDCRSAIEIGHNGATWENGIAVQAAIRGIGITNSDGGLVRGLTINEKFNLPSLISATQINNSEDGIVLQRFTDTSPTGNLFKIRNRANDEDIFKIDVNGNVSTHGNVSIGIDAPATTLGIIQEADGDTIAKFQRATDSAPTGYFMRLVNAADNDNIFSIDINGNIASDGGSVITGSVTCNVVLCENVRISTAAQSVASGTVCFGSTTATTVGAAGGASALPATPLGYMIAFVGSTRVKIPYYSE